MFRTLMLLTTLLRISLLNVDGTAVVGYEVAFHGDGEVWECTTDGLGCCEIAVTSGDDVQLMRGALHVRDENGRAVGTRALTWPPSLTDVVDVEMQVDDGELVVPQSTGVLPPEDAPPPPTSPPPLSADDAVATVEMLRVTATAMAMANPTQPPPTVAPIPTDVEASPTTALTSTGTPTAGPDEETSGAGWVVFAILFLMACVVVGYIVYQRRSS